MEPTTDQNASGRNRISVLGALAVVALGVGGVFVAFPQVQAATLLVDPISELEGDGGPVAVNSGDPALSNDGVVVAFVAGDEVDASDAHVLIRDRATDVVQTVAEVPSLAPAISGDGCVVAYSVPLVEPGGDIVELKVVDRCNSPGVVPPNEDLESTTVAPSVLPAGEAIDTIDSTGTYSDPAVSADGSVIVWSTGSEVRRYTNTGGSYSLADSFDSAIIASAEVMTGAKVDISADGNTVAFVAGPGVNPYVPAPANVYVWSQLDDASEATIELGSMTLANTPGTADSMAPVLSADASLLLFESVSQDLAATGGAATPTPFIVMLDRGNGTRVLADSAHRPAISADGRSVAYESNGSIRLMTWVSGTPYAVVADEAVTDGTDVGGAGESSSGPVVSRFGRWVVFDSDAGLILTDDVRFQTGLQVWAADQRPSDDGTIPDSTTTTTTTTTTDESTTSSTTTTTTGGGINGPAVTIPAGGNEAAVATTQPSHSTVPLGTLPPPTTFPARPFFPSGGSSGGSSRGSSGGSSGGSNVLIPDDPPVFDPAAVVFSPTIIEAGRRTATVTLSNPTSDTINLRSLSIDPAVDSPFLLLSENCSNTQLAVGGTCSIEVQFAPTAVGPSSAFLTVEISDGSVTTAQLTGDGSAEPTLDVVPGVAAVGQVVTVFGAGFPADAPVEFSWDVVSGSESVAVDSNGTFAYSVVVLSNTPSGPVTIQVAGKPDLFNDVSGELLVSGSGSGTNMPALRDGVGRPYGR